MPANTPAKALPYPLATEPVASGADNMRKLAQSVENMVQSGTVNTGTMVAGTPTDIPVVFNPAFAVAPSIVVTPLGSAPETQLASVLAGGLTAAGMTIRAKRISGTAAYDIGWVAVGKVTAVA
jgi:hypothetical protein